jgi:hypothetical protein
MFMKRALGVRKTAPSRLVYQLMRETYFVEDIRLPSTGPYQELIKSRDRKREEIDPEFYNTTAMLERTWSRVSRPTTCGNSPSCTRLPSQDM